MSYTTLVDVETLRAHLDDPNWLVVDVRHQLSDTGYGEHAYAAGHVPGAVFLHCDRDLSGAMSGGNGRHPLPDPERLAQRLGDIGIGALTQVVVYDDAQGMIAGRLWWLLRWLGHDAVALLDGGLPAWQAAGGTLTSVVPTLLPRAFVTRPQDLSVNADYVLERLETPHMRLVDARGADRFRGENETLDPVGGHIPGAINIPHRTMNAETTSAIDRASTVVTYCDGIGCNASTKGAYNMARLGFKVKELIGGLDWWKRDGHPTEGGAACASTGASCGCS